MKNNLPEIDGKRRVLSYPAFSGVMAERYRTAIMTGIICFAVIIYLLTRPFVTVTAADTCFLQFPAVSGSQLSIRFLHSVQKTLVWENHVVNEQCDGFVLKSTQYQSFGVGLPFLQTEGHFYQKGDYFIIDNFDRAFKELPLRTGLGTKLTILYNGKEYPVYQYLPVGTRVDVQVVPYWKTIIMNKN